MKKRIEWIDNLKAFACFLVVIGHLIQSLQKASIDNYTSITTYINWFIYLFHMPIFFALSGYIYSFKRDEFTWKNYRKFEIKKIINLGIPYFTFYILFVLINEIFRKYVNSVRGMDAIKNILNKPMPPYWFLYSLLSIFIVIPLIEKILHNNKKLLIIVFVLLKLISYKFNLGIYFIDTIMNNGIFFCMGYLINEKKQKTKINITNLIIYIIVPSIYYIILQNYSINSFVNDIILFALAIWGTYTFVEIFKNITKVRFINTFKKYTFQIYLLHTIFSAGIRIILFKVGISNYFIHFILGTICGIYFPVIIGILCDKSVVLNYFFYPINTIRKIKDINSSNKTIKETQ